MSENRKIIYIDKSLEEIIPQYLENRKKEINQLKESLSKKDFDAISHIGHKLNGNAASFGLQYLGRVGEILEQEGKKKNTSEIKKQIQNMINYINSINIEYR